VVQEAAAPHVAQRAASDDVMGKSHVTISQEKLAEISEVSGSILL
jgi:hypothetical protein